MFHTASQLSVCLGQCLCLLWPTCFLGFSPNLWCLVFCWVKLQHTVTCFPCCENLLVFLGTVISQLARVPVLWGCWDFYCLEWAQWSLKVLAGLSSRNVTFARFLRSYTRTLIDFFFVFICSAETPMPGLGHKPRYSLGLLWGTSLAPTMPFSAAAILAANLVLISSLLCFWQSKFLTQAWEFNISTFAWLIRFVSLLWRHCFYGKLMDSHVVFLMAETTPLPPFHPRAQRGSL